jgi:hypothetical protein
VVPVPRLRAVTGLTVIAPAMLGVAALVVLAGCIGDAADRATSRAATGTMPPGAPSEPFPPSTTWSPASSPTSSGTPVSPWTPARSAAQLVQEARDAFAGASSVHVTGTAVHGADAYVLDVRLAGQAGGTATIATSGQTVDVTRIGDVAYVGGDLPFWRSIVGNEAEARQMVGSHVRTGASEANFAAFVRFTQPSTYAAVLPDPRKPATLTGPAKIRGAPVTGARDAAGTTLYVAATGPAYPVRLDGLSAGQVVFLDFSEYGSAVPLRPPSTIRVLDQGPGS